MSPFGHSGDELRQLAQRRGLRAEELEMVQCFSCGVSAPAAQALRSGLAHWEDCDAETELRFKLRKPGA